MPDLSKEKLTKDDLCGDWYNLCTHIPEREWFSVWDCSYRFALSFFTFYFYAIFTPITHFRSFCSYYTIWYGYTKGILYIVTYPVYPFCVLLTVLLKDLKEALFPPEKNWMNSGAGGIFFVKPKAYVGAVLWDCYVEMSMFLATTLACHWKGYSADAMKTSYQDIYTTKTFWRKLFHDNDVRCPRELGTWTGTTFEKKFSLDCSLVIKLEDAYLGIGDKFLNYGEDFHSEDEILKILKTEYAGKEALLLEFVVADKNIGVHSFDIITFDTPEGPKALSCLLWCHCEGPSSHYTTAGYVVDIETETCISTLNWYCAAFTEQRDDYVREKRKIPGVKLAVAQALRAHKNNPFSWLRMIGWDCMLTDKGEMVFFEGNFAGARLPRRIFLSASNLFVAMTQHFWPFSFNPFV